MIVIDASALATALTDSAASGGAVRARLMDEELVAPHLIDLEVLSTWRKQLAAGMLSDEVFEAAIADLPELPMRRLPHWPLISRIWELRANVTPYDASYVAIAEVLGLALVTGDRRLARAPGLRCPVELVG